ncbi:hypothetical protein [Pilimelia columellifera]|uniref:Uncharacterized protein n=1 Tax=Pilimelia columellifera subsp. columellifera TaxID=706583 RepID=A0ABN3NJ47_9ACTN
MADGSPRRDVPAAHAAARDLVEAGQLLRALREAVATDVAAAVPGWHADPGLAAFVERYEDACRRVLATWQQAAGDLVGLGAAAAAAER